MEAEDLLKYMLNFFQNIDKELQKVKSEEIEINAQQQDLLHYIENTTLNAGGYAKVGKILKELRCRRREIKNDKDRLEIIKIFTTKYNNKMIQGDIVQLLKQLNLLRAEQSEPKYYCRTDILEEMNLTNENSNTVIVQKQEKQPANINKQ